ncbi:MAG: AAA family ATPase [Moorea sp. SIO3E8]|nr:ATP-binding protein [Moorena sp. SIO3E8]NEO17683.1 AAA family ATPase [Moorena sp. SIO3E8]
MTGAPASGKSSTLRKLEEAKPSIFRFEYGAELTKFVQERNASILDQEELRARSADIIRPEDVDGLDEKLLDQVDELRGKRPIVIDSHPVTKEIYGFRITAFSQSKIKRLQPDEIWVLFAAPDVIRERIKRAPDGRPMISEEEARTHTLTQASVAATYGVLVGAPVYFFDTDRDQEKLVSILLKRLEK